MAKVLGRGVCVYYLLFPSPPPLNTCQSGSVSAIPVTVTSEHIAKSTDSLRHFLLHETFSAFGSRPRKPPGLLPFFPGYSFSVSFLGSSSLPQCLNIGNRPDSVLGLSLVWSLPTWVHLISWLYILSICCWLQTYHSSPNLSPELQTLYPSVYLTFPYKKFNRQFPLKMSQTRPPDLLILQPLPSWYPALSLPSGSDQNSWGYPGFSLSGKLQVQSIKKSLGSVLLPLLPPWSMHPSSLTWTLQEPPNDHVLSCTLVTPIL